MPTTSLAHCWLAPAPVAAMSLKPTWPFMTAYASVTVPAPPPSDKVAVPSVRPVQVVPAEPVTFQVPTSEQPPDGAASGPPFEDEPPPHAASAAATISAGI